MSSGVDLGQVSRTLERFLVRDGMPIVLDDGEKKRQIGVRPDTAAAREGLLPALLIAGEAVWREVTGHGFELDIRRDPSALLGYRVDAIGSGSFTGVMLAMIEAKAQASGLSGFMVNGLTTIWRDVEQRLEPAPTASGRPASLGAAP
jgi:hypothetical protein